jgi:organic hydroperoxide reductase OsmC/OhrA
VYSYEAKTIWREGKEGRICFGNNPEIRVGTPPEFGGPSGVWSPEQLFVASVGSCLMSTFLFFAEKAAITLRSYESTAVGHMGKTPDGLRFTAIDVSITAGIEGDSDLSKARQLQSKLDKHCPISTSLQCPVALSLTVFVSERQ